MAPTFCLSDLHLHPQIAEPLFTSEKEGIFRDLCAMYVVPEGGHLVLAGDTFDLTGALVPENGLAAFFDRAYCGGVPQALKDNVPVVASAVPLDVRLQAIKQSFPKFFEDLKRVATSGRLTFIPGNHDHEAFPKGTAAPELLAALGLSANQVVVQSDVKISAIGGPVVVSRHGHEYDNLNSTDKGWRNRGAVLTSVLYNAVIPALRSHTTGRGGGLALSERLVAEIPAVRPLRNAILDIAARFLNAKQRDTFIEALVDLLVANGWPLDWRQKAWRRLFGISAEKLAAAVGEGDEGYETALPARAAQLAGWEGATVVVFGHTHDLLRTEPRYVNIGTWIDGVSHIGGPVDVLLPFLRVDDTSAAVYDAFDYVRWGAQSRVYWQG